LLRFCFCFAGAAAKQASVESSHHLFLKIAVQLVEKP